MLSLERWCMVSASSRTELNGKQEGPLTGIRPTCAAPATVSGRMPRHPARASCHWRPRFLGRPHGSIRQPGYRPTGARGVCRMRCVLASGEAGRDVVRVFHHAFNSHRACGVAAWFHHVCSPSFCSGCSPPRSRGARHVRADLEHTAVQRCVGPTGRASRHRHSAGSSGRHRHPHPDTGR